MTDILRSEGHLPLLEPYTGFGYSHTGSGGGEVTTNAVLSVTGNEAIVDWVILEIRDAANPGNVVVSKSALLQRDGDIVDVDGVSPVHFNDTGNGDILVAVRHRNHFGVRNTNALPSSGLVSLDFTAASTPTFGIDPLSADFNLDGIVNSVDKNSLWRLNNSKSEQLD